MTRKTLSRVILATIGLALSFLLGFSGDVLHDSLGISTPGILAVRTFVHPLTPDERWAAIGQSLEIQFFVDWAFWFVLMCSGCLLIKRLMTVGDIQEPPSSSLATVLIVPQSTFIEVSDVASASRWYAQKIGLRKFTGKEQSRPRGVVLRFSEDTHPVVLVPAKSLDRGHNPVFFTRNIGKARKHLIANGIRLG
ncbi:MAG: hypothetical protein ACRD3B_14735, partial [Candidatus Sulfotelmatobacter sp.]